MDVAKKLNPVPTSYNVIGLKAILYEDEVEALSAGSRFSWGDTDVTMVTLANFLEACDRYDLSPHPGVASLPDNTYIDLNG